MSTADRPQVEAGSEAAREVFMHELGCYRDDQGQWQIASENGDGASASDPPKHRNGSSPKNIVERCRRYVAHMTPSVSGSGGHDAAWLAAQVITRGFGLSEAEGWPVLREFSDRSQPPWSDSELRHKIKDAAQNSRLPWGYILERDPTPEHRNGSYQKYERERPEILAEDLGDIAPPLTTPPDRFPIEWFPPAMARFAGEVSVSLDCPIDLAAVPMLVIAGSVLGNSRALIIKRSWHESARFYCGVVATPGSSKSPAERMVKNPLIAMQIKKSAEWKDRRMIWQGQKEIYDAAAKRRSVSSESLPPKPGNQPIEPHLFTTDATTEVLHPILASNPRGIAFLCDELTAWLTGMNQYKGGKGRDRQFFISTWDGQPVKIDRKGKFDEGSTLVPRPFVNILGGIQPGMIHKLCEDGGNADGFIDRLLFSYPLSQPRGCWSEATVDERTELEWTRSVEWLYEREMIDDPLGQRPKFVRFTDIGKNVWRHWFNEHIGQIKPGDQFEGAWSKMIAYGARLALTIHFMRLASFHVTGEIDDDSEAVGSEPIGENVDARSMFAAWRLLSYFKSHLYRVYGVMESTPDDTLVELVIRWMANRENNRCEIRDLLSGRLCKKASEARKIVKDMADRGIVNVIWKNEEKHIIAGMVLKSPYHNSPVDQPSS